MKFDVNVPTRSNSGVYLRGRHEIQVSDSYGCPLGNRNMGALYSRIIPLANAEKPAGEWQKMDITFCDRHGTAKADKPIMDCFDHPGEPDQIGRAGTFLRGFFIKSSFFANLPYAIDPFARETAKKSILQNFLN